MAVLEVTSDVAARLVEKGKIKVSFVNCRIRPRLVVKKCFRCLDYGHLKKDCKGVDRSATCWKCGAAEHKGKKCRSRPSCFLCSEAKKRKTVHIAGTGTWAIFRTALENEKKANR